MYFNSLQMYNNYFIIFKFCQTSQFGMGSFQFLDQIDWLMKIVIVCLISSENVY